MLPRVKSEACVRDYNPWRREHRLMSIWQSWLHHTWGMMVETAPWLLLGFLLAGVIQVLIPLQIVARHLGGDGWMGVLKAAVLGIPLTLCSCSVLPVATTLRKQGAGKGATASFLISTPEIGLDSLSLSYALLGPILTIARPLAALVTSLLAGTVIHYLERSASPPNRENPGQTPKPACRAIPCCAEIPRSFPRGRFAAILRFGFVDLFADLAAWLFVGFALAGLIPTLLPPEWIGRTIGGGLPAMLAMLLVGLPMYVCATSSTPIAAALIAQGISPGAALVFLLAGPATNIATMLVVARQLGVRSLVVYLISIALVAVGFGLAVDAVFPLGGVSAWKPSAHAHPVGSFTLSTVMGAVLVALMLHGVWVSARRRQPPSSSGPMSSGAGLEPNASLQPGRNRSSSGDRSFRIQT